MKSHTRFRKKKSKFEARHSESYVRDGALEKVLAALRQVFFNEEIRFFTLKIDVN